MFTGSRTDTVGYGHEGEGGDSSTRLLARVDEMAAAQHYTVLVGTNDRPPLTPEGTVANIQAVAAALLGRPETQGVHVLTLLPRADAWNERNRQVNILLRQWVATSGELRLHLADTELAFRSLPDWARLVPDGIHPSAEGYEVLATFLGQNLSALLSLP